MKVMGKLEKDYGKKMPFEVPAGYFDGLTENIMSAVHVSNVEEYEVHSKVKVSKFNLFLQKSLPYISMAAIVSFVVVMVQLFAIGTNIDGTAVAGVDSDYLFESELDITDEEIIEYLSSSVYDVESFLASMQ